ncbi:MAG: cyclic beta 1-2 glucan synthetase [Nitrospirae bacterium]|nr:MAG: cyclic beta 1-2 glucan synthetase [Nitrospirota bacterium]
MRGHRQIRHCAPIVPGIQYQCKEPSIVKKSSKTILGSLPHLRAGLRGTDLAAKCAVYEPPLRAELFSSDQMEQHGRTLAGLHRLSPEYLPDKLLARLAENEGILTGTRRLLMEALTTDRKITPAGDWLLDNFYLIEEQIRTARRHLPEGYSRELPRLRDGLSAGLPRVYDIALETISHSDGRIDPQGLSRFVAAYQTVTSLKLGELWAIPIMLRLALIENLRRVGARIAADRLDRNQADHWADRITEMAVKDPKSLILVIADMARSNPPLKGAFVAEFAHRLQGQGPALAMPLTWLEQRLSECSLTIDHLVQSENQQQAADQVSMSNSIGSLRFLGTMDWREFVETMSIVEQTLREDPAGVYGSMDFATRDRYRHVVERLSKNGRLPESDVAAEAVRLAAGSREKKEADRGGDIRKAHVGYYLIDKGLPQLEELAGLRLSVFGSLRKMSSRFPLLLYLGPVTLLTALFTGGLLAKAHEDGLPGWLLMTTGILSVICTSQLAVALVNWLATLLVSPKPLPRMDFSKGIPREARTLTIVPTMLTGSQGIEDLIEALEVRFLANRDENLLFGLLTDLRDASEETLPEDGPLLLLASQRIEELNEKYGSAEGDLFFLFHRPRRWNARERVWMGYERKRGKLADLNALLRGAAEGRFSLIVGDTGILSGVRYVITLDTDTQLPRDSARQFVGAMAHPLNRPLYDEDRQRVVAGYGILQPRVGVSLPGTNRSRYARIYGSDPGIDPYTRAVSDVYQDLFGEGSFIGKGIYEVDAFERALAGRFPENRILSHDLIEGCYGRAGLLSDVMVYEEYPFRYSDDVSRRHRWIRGDWQLLRWLFPGVPGPDGRRLKNPLSLLSRWKLFDNLRRSLVPAALTLLLLLGWTVMSSPWFWTSAALGIILIPSLMTSALDLLRKPDDLLFGQHLAGVGRSFARHFVQVLLGLACLPYEAFFSLDAVLRTAWRMLISRKRLLEWSPSGDPDRKGRSSRMGGLSEAFRTMWFAPFLTAAAVTCLALFYPAALAAALPILILWFASPVIAWLISRPLARIEARLMPEQTVFLQRLSRKTWAFFETFVGPQEHWLPPDNYQEEPAAVIAHRTSPTNMGLALLANLSAHDFGYISTQQLIERTANTLSTMESLERYRGHFYNWYDTQSLKPLPPKYVSTVDSGNLAAHLLTLRQGLLALPAQNILGPRVFDGLRDTLGLLQDAVADAGIEADVPALLAEVRKELGSACTTRPASPAAARLVLEQLSGHAGEALSRICGPDDGPEDQPENQAVWWARAFAGQCRAMLDELTLFALPEFSGLEEIPTLRELALSGDDSAAWRMTAIEKLVMLCGELSRMDYDFLFDKASHLLVIGYNVDSRRRDTSYYDLLASEARLCSFVAIAQGQLPQESWFALGRLLTNAGGEPILVSWSGSMFEYLMPMLVMPTYERTLLDETCKAAVARQIEYGRKRGVAWGISESGYNTIDAQHNYQYRAFGVPGLGLKRGLADDLVIAPYASALALMVAPEEACQNLQRLAGEGAEGKYGFYEAVDHTPSRLPRRQSSAVVRSFMAHHQGMSFLSLAYLLLDRPMQKRFEADPLFQATTLLLQERVPRATGFYSQTADNAEAHTSSTGAETSVRSFKGPDSPFPQVQLLSNGRYHVMITNAGGGYSRWKETAVTRWGEDSTRDSAGTFCYIRETAGGEFWSAAFQPTLKRPKKYEAIFSEGRAEFRRRDLDFETHTEIAVSPEDDIELRRVTITNRGRTRREIEVTSYAEVVLAPSASDALHPAFSNLFVQTEIIGQRQAILCTRRPRSIEEPSPWMFHLMAVHGAEPGEVSYETDRMRFIGRGRTVADPQALSLPAGSENMTRPEELSGGEGSVLDPIVSIRYRMVLEPEGSATINIVTGIGEDRDICMGLVEKYQDRHLADRVFELAWTHSQVLLRQINATEADAQLYGRLAGPVIYANASLRADPGIISANRRGQSGLWGYSISGDLPIVLLQIGDPANLDLVRQLVQAHAYWRLKGLAVDLLIWNEDHAGYRQLLQEQIMGLIAAGVEANVTERPGGIFVRPVDQMSAEDRVLLQTVSRVIITDSLGPLEDQIDRRSIAPLAVPRLAPTRSLRAGPVTAVALPRRDLMFFNGLGGFTPDGREYIITTTHEQVTPAPWVNVLANPFFGTVISESGAAYTWSENAHEFRLTPWYNDPVSDPSGEALYLRDEESGLFWSPSPLPCRGSMHYVSRHGFGYSVFEHTEDGIRSEMWVYVAIDAPVKLTVLKLKNESGRSRRLSATGFVEWVLGDLRSKTAMHVSTEIDPKTGALFGRNPYNTEFSGRTAFFDTDDAARTVSGDRTEFLGRNGQLRSPAAMRSSRLSGRVGVGLDPCGAIQVPFDLADGQEREIIFRLGVGQDAPDAGKLVRRFRGPAAARTALEKVWQYWGRTLGAVQVETPDQSVNVLANGWLVYQTLACRLWARSGFYQSGGAFGFRDQLQDVMALIHAEPALARAQLLLCAARQFREGDVQHWWHPPSGRGVRTHCSDDLLWLPLAVCRYVQITGDTGVLDEPVSFIEGRPLNKDEDSYYDLPGRSGETATLYEHCVRAILNSLTPGAHGLPLIGSGDWNDGMNLVGGQGKGESIWLGFFLYEVLMRFAKLAHIHEDLPFAERCRREADELQQHIEQSGWDGGWYLRAYFDDGSPLGSAVNAECRIDSIAQSWSVLSGAGDVLRSRTAMDALDRHLVRRDHNLVQLLDPPFDRSDLNPGYIKGYVPGVRENGGQYTHAAVWAAMAFAALGDGRRAWELLTMINPVNHASSPEAVATYKVEPYVAAADVYAVPPHIGRGGWTWYTGSAGWMYRLILESLLGLRLDVDRLHFTPCLPADWGSFKLHYRYRETFYHISVRQVTGPGADGSSVAGVTVDGVEQPDKAISLVDDRQEHAVEVRIQAAGA